METKEIEKFYDATLQSSKNKYEYNRWQKNSQARASYLATKDALRRYAAPLLESHFSILEVGPGPGTWTKEILPFVKDGHYDVVDISAEMLKQARENIGNDDRVTFIHSDILDFIPTKQYDFFFSSRFLEYVPDKEKVVDTIHRSLKPGAYGYLVTKTPQYKRPFSRSVVSLVHQGQIADTELKKLFIKRGFTVCKVVNVTSVFPGLRSGLLDRCVSFFCRYVPFSFCRSVSESYAIIFKKNS